jgi:hypothetical protein
VYASSGSAVLPGRGAGRRWEGGGAAAKVAGQGGVPLAGGGGSGGRNVEAIVGHELQIALPAAPSGEG